MKGLIITGDRIYLYPRLSKINDEHLYLYGAFPHYAETEFGWIQPDQSTNHLKSDGYAILSNPMRIERFVEKPNQRDAEQFCTHGYLWNTMFMTGSVNFLWNLGFLHLPEIWVKFEWKRHAIFHHTKIQQFHESMVLHNLYDGLYPCDFSEAILQNAYNSCSVIPLTLVDWNDWGSPKRIRHTIEKHNLKSPVDIYEKGKKYETIYKSWRFTL